MGRYERAIIMTNKEIGIIINGNFIEMKINEKKDYKIKGAGIYVILDNKRTPLYIGKTINFCRRMASHHASTGLLKFIKEKYYIRFIFTDKLEIETDMIRYYKPKYNGKGITCYTNNPANLEYIQSL